MIELNNLTQREMISLMESIGEKPFRGKQIFNWISKAVEEIGQMTNLPLSLREKLEEIATINSLKVLEVQRSSIDETGKYLLETKDGHGIEAVFMKYNHGYSLCISSQVGCKMGCNFCGSTIGGKVRDLTGGEMYDQILAVERDTGKTIGNVVVMGIGEPFDNIENLFRFFELVHDPNGLNIGMRSITVSTCGILPGILEMAKRYPQVNLAISLHAPTSELRRQMMPIENKYPLDRLLDTCKEYVEITGRRITFEYTLIENVNDSSEHIGLLASKLRGLLCHVNLIPLNEIKERDLGATGRGRAREIAGILTAKGIPATVRRTLGQDIDAACGQLRNRRGK